MARKFKGPQFDGVLLVDKPMEWTSHDVVNLVRRRFHQNKVGHAGTLDPAATGLLVILVGKGTKWSNQLTGDSKRYLGEITLGQETSSADAEGEVIGEFDWSHVTDEKIFALKDVFSGDLEQVPPMVSALKRDGVPLYKLAREGKEVERAPRLITIHELAFTDISLPKFSVDVFCSKGTYIRSLAVDMGRALESGAFLSGLRRTQSGRFSVTEAVTIETIKSWESEQDLADHLISLESLSEES